MAAVARLGKSSAALRKFTGEEDMQGKKTHEQTLRTLERKPDVADARQTDSGPGTVGGGHSTPDPGTRQSEFPISKGGMHQESRDHNKHNNSGQSGHKAQEPSPSQEKH